MPVPYLADELLDNIASHLDGGAPECIYTLWRMLFVSKQFHRVAKPHLYRTVNLASEKASQYFGRTTLINPLLGEDCRKLVLQESLLNYWGRPRRVAKFNEKVMGYDESTYKRIFRNLPKHLPNVEYIDVSMPKQRPTPDDYPLPWMMLLLRAWTHEMTPTTFQCVKRVDADIYKLPLADLYRVVKLPTLETLNITNGRFRVVRDSPATPMRYLNCWRFTSPNIKHLSLRGVKPQTDRHTLTYLAAAIPALESLILIGSKKYGYGANMHRSLMAFFRRVTSNPQFRRLEVWDERTTKPDRWTALQFLTFTYGFATNSPVTSLKIDADILEILHDPAAGILKLPRGLRHLHLRSTSGIAKPNRMSSLVRLLWDVSIETPRTMIPPNLETVTVELQVHDLLHPKVLQQIARGFEEMRVVVKFVEKRDCVWSGERIVGEILARANGKRNLILG